MVKGRCIHKCYIDRMYKVGETKWFNTKKEITDHPHFDLIKEPKTTRKRTPKKVEKVEDAE